MAPPEITLVDIYRSIVPFFFLMVISVIIIMIFPQIALWLPELYYGTMRLRRKDEHASSESNLQKEEKTMSKLAR